MISDLKGQLGYPVLGRIRSLEQDSDGLDRYYIVEYKTAKEKFSFSKNLKQVKRRANSLVLIIGTNNILDHSDNKLIARFCPREKQTK